MDDIFNAGIPAWRTYKKPSRLDELQSEIERGNLKVVPTSPEHAENVREQKA
jgi:hypothetical protein